MMEGNKGLSSNPGNMNTFYFLHLFLKFSKFMQCRCVT